MKFIFVSLCLVVVSNEGLAERCETDNIIQSLLKVDPLMNQRFRALFNGEDFNFLCWSLEQELEYLKSCEALALADFPKLPKVVPVLDFYIKEFCGENGKMYEDMAPCFKANVAVFKQCNVEVFSVDDAVCKLVHYVLCMAQYSKENCKNGEAFGNALEKRMNIMKSDVCTVAVVLKTKNQVLNGGLAQKCKEDNTKKCVSTLQLLVTRFRLQEKKTDEERYCKILKREVQCLKNISKSCLVDDKNMFRYKLMLPIVLSEYCAEDWKMYMVMDSCFRTNKAVYDKCIHQVTSNWRNEDYLCEFIEGMKCEAEISKNCKYGKDYENALNKRIDELKSDFCSGASHLINSFWTFSSTVLSVLLRRNKLQ